MPKEKKKEEYNRFWKFFLPYDKGQFFFPHFPPKNMNNRT
jgi:hypothetical protein